VRTEQTDLSLQLEKLRLEVAELRATLRRLTLVHDAESRGIERDLHDGVQQELVGLAADLELAAASAEDDPARVKELLGSMGRDVRTALDDTRALADRIYPPLLERGGLVPALRTAATRARVPAHIHVAAGVVLPSDVARVVYSCCRDLLERAGPGTPVSITVRNEEATLVFDIGIDCELDTDGLPSRDRCEALGGSLLVGSASERRTRLIGTVPLSG
jgi:signal transduction histidine kinase